MRLRGVIPFVAIALALAGPGFAAPPKKKPSASATPQAVDPFIKNTVWSGKIAAVDATGISVTNEKALTRRFSIYSGTIFGRGGSAALSDFKKGDQVTVNFSEVPGSNVGKAENISPPKVPRAGRAKKK